MRASSLASAHLQADVSWQRRGAAELSSRSSSGLHACVLAQQQHKLRSQRPSPRLDGERRLFATTTAAAQQSRNSSAGKKRGVDSKSKPATGAAGQLLLNKLAAGPQEVALKEAQQALSAVKGSPDTLWALYSALRGRVAGGLDPRRALICAPSACFASNHTPNIASTSCLMFRRAGPAAMPPPTGGAHFVRTRPELPRRSYGLVISGVAKGSGWDALKRAKEVHADFLQVRCCCCCGLRRFCAAARLGAKRVSHCERIRRLFDAAARPCYMQAGFPNDAFVLSGLISAYGRAGDSDGAQAAWDEARHESRLLLAFCLELVCLKQNSDGRVPCT